MAKAIALSAGHGAGDAGAVYKDLQEASLTVKIVKKTLPILQAHGVQTREVPDNLNLFQTIQWINQVHSVSPFDLCLEVHINSGGGTGVEAWHYAGGGPSKTLSQHLADAMAAETGLKNRGVKDESTNRYGGLGFVHDTIPLASLVECGFIDGDYAFLKVDENLGRMAKGVARGCLSYLGIPWKPELIAPAPPPLTDAQKLEKIKDYLWYDDAWWNSLYRVKKMREIVPK